MGADAAAREQFGPYVVYERLGVGGMATVHRALERGIEGFERIVALKRLLPHLAEDASFIKSFVREAKLASLLNHVNIVQIFELGRVATQYFISMEYIDGRDIRQILRHARKVSGPPPIHVTVGLLLQLCDALDYAHHKADDTGHPLGLIHRDVSPSNVLVTSAGQVKVIDFGIAKAQSSQLRTQTGRVKGKLAYMAPEVLAGKDFDARSDLFAAGVIAHELLTARPLFASKNEYQTLMKVQRGEVMPPSTFNQGCPPELDAIVLRALARDPDDRFRHAGELRDELHAMRKQYNLQAADRDVASWLEWAFRLDAPEPHAGHAGFAGSTHQPDTEHGARSQPRHRPSREPRRHDDDEAVELAWGSHDEHASGEPLVLDDVPDVSDQPRTGAGTLGADARIGLDDLADDDIPTPRPSHGRPTIDLADRPTINLGRRPINPAARAENATATVRQLPRHLVRNKAPTPAAPVRTVLPPRVRTITTPPRTGPAASAPNSVTAAALPPRIVPASAEPSRGVPAPVMSSPGGAIAAEPSRSPSAAEPSRGAPAPIEPSHADPAPPEPSRSGPLPRPRRSGPVAMQAPDTIPSLPPPPRQRRAASPRAGAPPADVAPAPMPAPADHDATPRTDTTATERTPVFAIEDLGLASDTMPSIPKQTSESVVRFHDATPASPDGMPALPDGPEPPAPAPASAPASTPAPPPASGPAPGPTPAPARAPTRTETARTRLVTPATELFAEPEDPAATGAAAASAHGVPRPSHGTLPGGQPVVRRRVTLGRVLIAVVVLVLLSAAATAAALYLTQEPDVTAQPPPSAPPVPPVPRPAAGTVHFEVVPADSAITIAGEPVHAGSPWDVELDPGVHQIEIDHEGYKGWLTAIEIAAGQTQTLQVALEPLGPAVAAEATLILGSTPGGLDIIVDGAALARTPGKLSIAAGRHSVALRANGADIWSKDIDARASAVYEFHPVLAGPAGRPSDAPGAQPAPGPSDPAAAPPAAGPGEPATEVAPSPAPPDAAPAP